MLSSAKNTQRHLRANAISRFSRMYDTQSTSGGKVEGNEKEGWAQKLPRTPTIVFNPALPARHAPTGDREKLGHDSVFNVFLTPDQSTVESEENKDFASHCDDGRQLCLYDSCSCSSHIS